MQGIYIYVPETNPVASVNNVAAVLYLQFIDFITYIVYRCADEFLTETYDPNRTAHKDAMKITKV